MKNRTIRWFILLGALAIITNVGIQLHLLKTSIKLKQTKHSQTIQVALYNVIQKMYGYNPDNWPESSPVMKMSDDYYVVDVNDYIDASVLESYLRNEFRDAGIQSDFEYGIYNCETDQMVYGNYVSVDPEKQLTVQQRVLPKHPGLVYYFGVRFPGQRGIILGSLRTSILLTSVSMLILLFFAYAIFMVLRQKKLSELQRDFVNNMTHEFKTPLTAIRLALDSIGAYDEIEHSDRLNNLCSMIGSQTNHLNSQVERILQTSVSEKGSFILERRNIDLCAILDKIEQTFRNNTRSINIECPDKTITISADEIHLTNVIYSLLDNAIKYSEPASEISLKMYKEKKRIILSVTDHGHGIEQNQLKKIFRKFYRVSTGDIHNVKGFGLGLYYVKKVCDQHGWRIKVNSEPGKGSEFRILIPVKR